MKNKRRADRSHPRRRGDPSLGGFNDMAGNVVLCSEGSRAIKVVTGTVWLTTCPVSCDEKKQGTWSLGSARTCLPLQVLLWACADDKSLLLPFARSRPRSDGCNTTATQEVPRAARGPPLSCRTKQGRSGARSMLPRPCSPAIVDSSFASGRGISTSPRIVRRLRT